MGTDLHFLRDEMNTETNNQLRQENARLRLRLEWMQQQPIDSLIDLLFYIGIGAEQLYHKAGEPLSPDGQSLLSNEFIMQLEPETDRFIYQLTTKGTAALKVVWKELRDQTLEATDDDTALT